LLLGILKETAPGETRVALLPESLKSLIAQGIAITVESGAGLAAGASDRDYVDAGAIITTNRASLLASADLLPLVNAQAQAISPASSRAVVIGFLKPLDAPHALAAAIARPTTLFSMELVPASAAPSPWMRSPRMATVAGYKAVIAAADRLPRLFPMLMTAAGTSLRPAFLLSEQA